MKRTKYGRCRTSLEAKRACGMCDYHRDWAFTERCVALPNSKKKKVRP